MIGNKVTVLRSLPCLVLLGGICLALKPYFIFGHDNIDLLDRDTLTNKDDMASLKSFSGNQYWVGISISLLRSLTSSMNKIIPKMCRTNSKIAQISNDNTNKCNLFIITMEIYLELKFIIKKQLIHIRISIQHVYSTSFIFTYMLGYTRSYISSTYDNMIINIKWSLSQFQR